MSGTPKYPNSMPLSIVGPMNAEMPATVRKRLIVSGQVQDVGYRAFVKRNARRLGLLGFTRNLPDETVEIICEGEPGALADFMRSIDVKGDPADPFSLHVTVIKEAPPAPEGALKLFYTDYGRKLSEIQRQTFDREEIMVLRAGTLNSNVGVVGQKVDGVGKAVEVVGQKVDGVGKAVEVVGQKVDGVGKDVRNMHGDMNTRFDHMADHYDMIAASLKEAIVHMDRNAEKTDKAIEKSRKETIVEVQKSQKETAKILSESRKDVAASNRELARAVNFMIKKLSDRPASKRLAAKRKR
jgi:acylphosphatase